MELGSVLRLLCSSQHGLGPRLGSGPGPLPMGHASSQRLGLLCQLELVTPCRLSPGRMRHIPVPAPGRAQDAPHELPGRVPGECPSGPPGCWSRPRGAAASAAGHLVTSPLAPGRRPLCHGDCQARAPRLLQGTSPGCVGRPVGRLGAELALRVVLEPELPRALPPAVRLLLAPGPVLALEHCEPWPLLGVLPGSGFCSSSAVALVRVPNRNAGPGSNAPAFVDHCRHGSVLGPDVLGRVQSPVCSSHSWEGP